MKEEEKSKINYFFVHVFNQILSWEEQSFRESGISGITLRELHVVEAVSSLLKKNENRMSEIARYLSITPGSLTTAVNSLVKKGFLKRESLSGDRRVVMIVPTEMAERVNEIHSEFHKKMIDEVLNEIDEAQAEVLIKTLEGLSQFFAEKNNLRG